MLPVCSATTSSSCHAQIPIHGGLKASTPYWKTSDVNVDKIILNFPNGPPVDRISTKAHLASCFAPSSAANNEQCASLNTGFHSNGLGSIKELTRSVYRVGVIDEPHHLEVNGMVYVDNSSNSAGDLQLIDFIADARDSTDALPSYTDLELASPFQVDPPLVSDSLDIDVNSSSGGELNIPDIVSDLNESTAATISGAEDALNKSFDTINSSVTEALRSTREAVDDAVNTIVSFVTKSGESAGNKVTGLSGNLKDASGKVGILALDALRKTVVVAEDSLMQGAKTVGYAYSSVKELLPQEIHDTLDLSEESVIKVLQPIGTAFQQVYVVLEGFEASLGLDPSDPLIPLSLAIGLSASLWALYWVSKYSGYAGDLSVQSVMDLLQGNENVVLIDIRPEDLRERDGIPDLRRKARFRYTSVTLPEVEGSVRKLLKGGRDLEDSLLAAVIRNLKIVEDRSKVLVLDADGSRSKSVARSLRKLGTKRPYLVEGGFSSWVKEGLRVKELKPETTLTILNEEAEAILEELNPTPLKLVALGLGLAAAAYSLAEWETTLQFIGVVGIVLTIYRRLDSYQDAEDFKQDVRLLLAPARLGGQAISWATGKLEPALNGLPTSPSSSDVQSRVLQAAAKHESQPSDTEEAQDSSQVAASGSKDVNLSEA